VAAVVAMNNIRMMDFSRLEPSGASHWVCADFAGIRKRGFGRWRYLVNSQDFGMSSAQD